jgi:hypothetical protein
MSSHVPPEGFMDMLAWMNPVLEPDHSENTTRGWQMVMPAPVFGASW